MSGDTLRRKKIIDAMYDVPHSITDERAIFYFDRKAPGHNALNQLVTQLEKHFASEDPHSMSSEALAAHIAELQLVLNEKRETETW